MRTMLLGLFVTVTFGLSPALADEVRTETVRFPAGATGTVIDGTITGRDSVLYKIDANAGQFMTVTLQSNNNATYFNVYQPGRGPGDEALAVGATTGDYMPDINSFAGPLPVSGEYTIAVYLYRNAARRGERSDYELDLRINDGDYADGFTGGPDYWEVTGVPANDLLNLRTNPDTSAEILAKLPNGTPLRNNGCESVGGQNWCRVETVDGSAITGWVSNRYLVESSFRP